MILIISWRDIPHNSKKMPCTLAFSSPKADYETPVVTYREKPLVYLLGSISVIELYYFSHVEQHFINS